jgi:hypothetical protein
VRNICCQLQVTGGGWAVLDWSRDEKRLLIGEYISVNESRLHILDTAARVFATHGFADASINAILEQAESALRDQAYLCGALSIADFALFPHVSSLKPLGMVLDERYPQLSAWNRRLRGLAVVQQDLEYVRRAARDKFVDGPSPYEGERIVWRGDRIEWLFHNDFVDWWYAEYRAGRATVPGSFNRAG